MTVRVSAAYTKNHKVAIQPLRPDLAALLQAFLTGRDPSQPVWPGTWTEKGAKMLQRDLKAAGVPYVDEDGRYRDFHSLRHRFGTGLAMANVPPKVMQNLMRHSTITLTMDRYSHVALHDAASAVDMLPPIQDRPTARESHSARATGDSRPILPQSCPTIAPRDGRIGLGTAGYCQDGRKRKPGVDMLQTLYLPGFGHVSSGWVGHCLE